MRNQSNKIYRVDKFVVPESSREEFLERVQQTHELLRTLPGFLQDFVLEQFSDTSEYNFVTLVGWKDMDSIKSAKNCVQAMHKEKKFNPQKMYTRLGIKADLGNYHSTEI